MVVTVVEIVVSVVSAPLEPCSTSVSPAPPIVSSVSPAPWEPGQALPCFSHHSLFSSVHSVWHTSKPKSQLNPTPETSTFGSSTPQSALPCLLHQSVLSL